MSEEVEKYHEEEAIGKTYDFRVVKRLAAISEAVLEDWSRSRSALTLLTNILVSTQPYFTKMAVDDFITPKRIDGIWLFALAFFGVFLFRFIFSYMQEILLNNVGQRVMFDLRTEIFTKLQQQEVAYYDKYPVGRIITRLTSDVDALNELFTSGVIDVLGDLVVIFAIIGMMFWLDWKLALVSLITVPLLFACDELVSQTRPQRFRPRPHAKRKAQRVSAGIYLGRPDRSADERRGKGAEAFSRDQRRLPQREYRDDLLLLDLLPAGRFYRSGRHRGRDLLLSATNT